MKNTSRHLTSLWRFALSGALILVAASWTSVSAQNPITVLVEGNTCGDTAIPEVDGFGFGSARADYDGDGDTGLAEDTDGDTVYGTIQGALEAIDHNGKVVVVTSGCFYENVYIGQATGGFPFGANVPGNVTLEAAPGVEAVIDAFAPAIDPASAGNNARSQGTGITVNYTTNGTTRVVTLRNLQVRNFGIGVAADNNSRANIDRLRVENNVFYGIRFSNNTRGSIAHTHVTATGFRISTAPAPPPPAQALFFGSGIFANQTSNVNIVDTVSSNNASYGISANTATGTPTVVVSRVNAPANNTAPTFGPITQCTNTALCP